jgi:FkbM family methyltransferase
MFRTGNVRALGGYELERDTTCEDWELFVKLLNAGFSAGIVPEYLYYYRHRDNSLLRTTSGYRNHQRVLRQYFGKETLTVSERIGLWTGWVGMQQRCAQVCASLEHAKIALEHAQIDLQHSQAELQLLHGAFRYRLADRANMLLKMFPVAHFLGKRALAFGSAVRRTIPRLTRTHLNRWQSRLTHANNLGLRSYLRNVLSRRHAAQRNLGLFPLHSKHALHPLYCRPNSSDYEVFHQVFYQREYSCLDDIHKAELIIDCGANVGYSSAYFLTRYPAAKVIAIEPDKGNFEMLQRNVALYGVRAEPIHSAIWSHPRGLVISDDRYRDGREWTRQVRECRGGEPAQMTAVDVASLLDASGSKTISILKVDIERAEAVVFATNYDKWINRVDNIVIELHDDECAAVFFKAIANLPFIVSRHGELTVCKKVQDL